MARLYLSGPTQRRRTIQEDRRIERSDNPDNSRLMNLQRLTLDMNRHLSFAGRSMLFIFATAAFLATRTVGAPDLNVAVSGDVQSAADQVSEAGSAPTKTRRAVAKHAVEQLIHHDDFEDDLSSWAIEQSEGGTSQIRDGAQEIEDGKGCTIWFMEKLEAPVLSEYDIKMIEAGGPVDRVSDLNCFVMAIDRKNSDDLLKNGPQRGGDFKNYHGLRLYCVGHGANDNSTARFRRYPGDETRPVLPGHDLKASHIPNQTRHVQIISTKGRFLRLIDGKTVFDIKDPDPSTSGWFGFRTVRNHMTIDNFRVWLLRTDAL